MYLFAQTRLDLRPAGFKPIQQILAGCIAKPDPDNLRPISTGRRPDGEIAILGDDDPAIATRDLPYRRVAHTDPAEIDYVGGFMAAVFDPGPQRRRQLGVDQKFHAAMTAVSPIEAAA